MADGQREPSRLSATYAAERAVEARQQVENAIDLLKGAARGLKSADILWREMKSLLGICDCLSVIHRSLDDHWARWRDTAARAAASRTQTPTAVDMED